MAEAYRKEVDTIGGETIKISPCKTTLNPFEPMEQYEDEYGPTSFSGFDLDEEDDPMEDEFGPNLFFGFELDEEDEYKLMEQIEDEYGPTSFSGFDEEDEYDPMDAMEESYNNRPCFMDELEEDDYYGK